MDWNKAFENNLRENGKAEKTIQSYTGDLSGFLAYMEGEGLTFDGTLNKFAFLRYKNHLLFEGYEPSTINKKVNSLQSFNQFLVTEGVMESKIIDLGRDRIQIAHGSEKPVEVYSKETVEALLFHMECRNKTSERDQLIVKILLYTGVRVSELCSIKIKDIDFLAHQLKVYGKGGKYREIPLKVEVVDSIKKYMIDRRKYTHYKSEYLLIGQRGALGRDAINRILVRVTRDAKLPQKLKPHAFRHTFCTNLIGKGVPLTTVSNLAGHSQIETTARFYIGCSRQEKMSAVNLL